jgi:uncharacterized protein (DUF983 family)
MRSSTAHCLTLGRSPNVRRGTARSFFGFHFFGKQQPRSESPPMTINIWESGLLCLCPACGKAPLFDGLITIKAKCPKCGADFASQEAGEGPAVFVILVAGAICVPFILIAQLIFKPPIWLLCLIGLPLTAGVCLGLMRPFKAMLFAMQWHHKAGEGVQAVPKKETSENG